ncbi:Clarin-3 [Orchesella cincta]|uniref:Clarin-3 n=1 Tax=Orchesella cincta TaxID=48709 RepID=A0A1D2ND48_ORCCI|nr:Clarin-3 [Orchesella cincta]
MSGLTFRRGMTFVSFITCCAALALLLAALSTQRWIVARAHRKTTTNVTNTSDGRIHLGLFYGRKHLNVGYGWRPSDINVIETLNNDKNFMSYGLWVATIGCVCLAILFAVFSAVFALVNTATTPVEAITGIPGLYLWNSCALVCNLGSLVTWGIQYHLKLRHNVLPIEDRKNTWTSEGLAVLGYSFWFVVGAAIIHILNLVLIFLGAHQNRRDRHKMHKPIQEEKTNGAIMLY